MALTKITKADLDAAIKKLTTSDATVWWKVLATTDEGTDLCFVVGWEYYDDKDDSFYQDMGYTICAKIGYKPHNLMVMGYDDIYMPFDKKTGDVWDTDSAVDKDHSHWDMLVRNYNSSASAIWRKYGKPNRDGLTALDLMESKKSEAKKHTSSMQKKIESFKKNEAQGMKKIYHIKSLFTDVYEDSYEKGELGHVNNWSGREVLGQKMYDDYDSIGDILRMLNAKYLYMWKGSDNIKNWAIFEDDSLEDEIRFDCDTLVDVENYPADDTDIENWKQGKTKLYNAHSVLYVTAEYATYASTDELTKEAAKLGLDTI